MCRRGRGFSGGRELSITASPPAPQNLSAGGAGAHIMSDKRDDRRCHYLFSHNLRITAGQSRRRGPIKAGGKRSCVTVTQRETFCPSLFWLVCTTGTEWLLCSTLFFFFFNITRKEGFVSLRVQGIAVKRDYMTTRA